MWKSNGQKERRETPVFGFSLIWIKHVLSEDAELGGAVDTLEGRDGIQWDLHTLERWPVPSSES